MIGRNSDDGLAAPPAPPRHLRRRKGEAGLARTVHLAVGIAACAAMFLGSPGRPALAAPAVAGSPCGPAITVIACENSLPGDPVADWQIAGSGDATIQGFATDMSVNVGGTVAFKISTPATGYHIDILRIGYYQGNGARKIVPALLPSASLPQSQPNCLSDVTTGLVDCGNWAVSASWTVPATAVSGVYIAHLIRNDTGGSSQIIFVVRNDASTADVFFQTSDPTWQAYNRYGGNDFYAGGPFTSAFGGRAAKVSYNRPMLTRDCCEEDFFFHAEYPVIRFLEANGYDTSYTSGVDSDRNGGLIRNHKVFVSTGHDEYWSGAQRVNVETARDAGVNLAFISGNNIYWKTRWEAGADGTGYRVLVCYKETWANQVIDPRNAAPTWTSTGTWRDPRFSPPADAGRPENSLTGTLFTVNAGTLTMQVPSAYAALRFWRNTAVAALTPGQILSLAPNSLGYEWDEDVDNGFRPAGVLDMSSTTGTVERITDYGGSVGPGSATHHLTLYRAASGALVFSAGTVQWAWGLDDTHDATLPAGVDLNMQQATVNLLADMQAQPTTLQAAYKPAIRSTDVTPPQSSITGPGTIAHTNTAVVVTGTARDAGGGVVAGVEVSTDGGGTWHPATGTTNWSYTWLPASAGTSVLQSRAVDDSGNLERPSAGVQAAVVTACPCSLWSSGATPDTASESKDSSSVEIGTRFVSSRAGKVTGVSFYKGAGNTGTHTGTLWSAAGTALASVTFSNETATGWQTAAFAQPVMVTAGTQYVISYHAPLGHYADSLEYFAISGHGAGPLQAPRDVPTAANGVYAYAPSSVFPALTHEATNYWVDVVFSPTTGPGVTASPASGARGVDPGTAVNATFSAPVQASTIAFSLVQSGGGAVPAQPFTYNSLTMTASLQPANPLFLGTAYTASVQATDTGGGAMPAPYTWTFVTTPAPLHVVIMDGFGGLHTVGSVNTDGAPYWPGRAVARGIAQLPEKPGSSGGYTLDAFGGVHPWGTATTVVTAAWPGWDIARGLALNPCDTSGNSGYVLDGFGGVHAFGGAPEITVTAYWPNWDVARSLALNPCAMGDTAVTGYVMDAFGGLHGMSSGAGIADISGAPYWPGWAIARGLVLSGHGQGYTLDGFGGVHAFGGAPVMVASVYWPGWDIARGITLVPGGAGGGYVLDGFGGIHAFGTPTPGTSPAYWPGWDIAGSISSG